MSGTAGPASLVQLLKTDPTKQTQSQSAKVRTATFGGESVHAAVRQRERSGRGGREARPGQLGVTQVTGSQVPMGL